MTMLFMTSSVLSVSAVLFLVRPQLFSFGPANYPRNFEPCRIGVVLVASGLNPCFQDLSWMTLPCHPSIVGAQIMIHVTSLIHWKKKEGSTVEPTDDGFLYLFTSFYSWIVYAFLMFVFFVLGSSEARAGMGVARAGVVVASAVEAAGTSFLAETVLLGRKASKNRPSWLEQYLLLAGMSCFCSPGSCSLTVEKASLCASLLPVQLFHSQEDGWLEVCTVGDVISCERQGQR